MSALPVGDRNLVVIGVDFVEGQEAVPVAAVVHKGGLKRRLYARDLGQIDVPAKKFAGGTLEVEFLYPAIPLNTRPLFPRGAWHR